MITLLRHCEACVACRGNLLMRVTAVQCYVVVLNIGRLPRHGCSQGYASFLVMTALMGIIFFFLLKKRNKKAARIGGYTLIWLCAIVASTLLILILNAECCSSFLTQREIFWRFSLLLANSIFGWRTIGLNLIYEVHSFL